MGPDAIQCYGRPHLCSGLTTPHMKPSHPNRHVKHISTRELADLLRGDVGLLHQLVSRHALQGEVCDHAQRSQAHPHHAKQLRVLLPSQPYGVAQAHQMQLHCLAWQLQGSSRAARQVCARLLSKQARGTWRAPTRSAGLVKSWLQGRMAALSRAAALPQRAHDRARWWPVRQSCSAALQGGGSPLKTSGGCPFQARPQ